MSLEKISKDGIFSIVALDHRKSLKKILNPQYPNSVERKVIEKIKLDFSKVFSRSASAILIDPEYGKEAIKFLKSKKCGTIISLEKSGYFEKNGERLTELLKNFNPREAKKLGADAVKLLVYFNQNAKSIDLQKELVKKISEECKKIEIPFVCEVLVYPLKEKNFEKEKSRMIINAARQFSRMGINLLKSEFPGRIGIQRTEELVKNCRKLSKNCKVPWVLLSRGIEYKQFEEQLKIAIAGSASGFIVGRALWQDYFKLKGKARSLFLKKEAIERLEELKRMAKSKVS